MPRHVADCAARGEREALRDFVSTYLVGHLAVGIVALVAGAAAAPVLASRLLVPETLRGLIAPAWLLVVAGWALGLTAGLFQSLLTGLGEVHLANLANAARTIFNLAVAAGVVWAGGDLVHLLLGFAAASVVASLSLFALVARRHPEIRPSFARARWSTLRATARPAGYYFLMQVAALVVMGTDNIVIGAFLGVGAVASYAVAFQLWAAALAVLWSGVDALLPFFTRWDARGNVEALRNAYLRATSYAFAGSAVCAVALAGFGRVAIRVWVGPDLPIDERLLWVFAGMLVLATPIHTASLVLAAVGRHRAPAIGGSIEAVLNLALSIALVRPLGLLGVALGTLLSAACTNAWIAPRAANRDLGIPGGIYLRRALLPGMLAGIALGAAAAVGRILLR